MVDYDKNLNYCWSSLIVEELVRNGIDYFCISPGSRSTPLTAAAATNNRTNVNVFYDERGSGYHAIGYGRFRNFPAAVITTSGTAVANLYPSIIEAYNCSIPLLVITADRPPELQDINSNQTIDQVNIFGRYVKWFLNLPCPDENIKPEFVLDSACYAVKCSLSKPSGPVHINCRFRLPLEPEPFDCSGDYLESIGSWNNSNKPYTQYIDGFQEAPGNEDPGTNEIIDIIGSTEKGLVSVGTLSPDADKHLIIDFTRKLNWPVYADVTSGLRLAGAGSNIIRHFDQELLSDSFNLAVQPQTVLHFGGRITSKRFGQFFEQNKPRYFIAINENGDRYDPVQGFNIYLQTPIEAFIKKASGMIEKHKENSFTGFYEKMNTAAQKIIEANIADSHELDEVFVARHISETIAEGSSLFLSSSMPVRDMDLYGTSGRQEIFIGSNRGVSGIDGVIASASGFTYAGGNACTLLIGDQAFIHDMNSLSIISRLNLPVTVVVINNRGGGIFDFLPISKHWELCEKYFTAPHDYNFSGVCDSFGIEYFLIENREAFIEKYNESINKYGPSLLEIKTGRACNLALRRKIKAEIIEMLDGYGV